MLVKFQPLHATPELSATLPLPDYGRVARYPPAIGKLQMELPTSTTALSFLMRSSCWRQYERDSEMGISSQSAQTSAPVVLRSGDWNEKQSRAADCRLYCGRPTRRSRSGDRGSGGRG